MTAVKLASALPKGSSNGLGLLHRSLIDEPNRVHVVVALLDCKSTNVDNDTGEITPTGRIRRIEVVTDAEDMKRLLTLVRRAFEIRTGQTVLPLDIEDDLSSIFKSINLQTGEVIFPTDDEKPGDGK